MYKLYAILLSGEKFIGNFITMTEIDLAARKDDAVNFVVRNGNIIIGVKPYPNTDKCFIKWRIKRKESI